MNKLGNELVKAWNKKELINLEQFAKNEIPGKREEAYEILEYFYKK